MERQRLRRICFLKTPLFRQLCLQPQFRSLKCFKLRTQSRLKSSSSSGCGSKPVKNLEVSFTLSQTNCLLSSHESPQCPSDENDQLNLVLMSCICCGTVFNLSRLLKQVSNDVVEVKNMNNPAKLR